MKFKFSVRKRLLNYINQSMGDTKQDNNYFLAKFFFENFETIPNKTIYEVSEESYVSTAAISRFTKKLGFTSFIEFKGAIADSIDISNDYAKKFTESTQLTEKFITDFTQNIIEDIQQIQDQLNLSQLQNINKLIFNSTSTTIFGLEFVEILGQHLQNKYAEMNRLIELGYINQNQLKKIEKMNKSDVALIFSVEGGFFYYGNSVVEALKERGVKIIVFTQNSSPMIERTADEIFLLGSKNSNTEGRIMLLYVMEILIYDYFLQYKSI